MTLEPITFTWMRHPKPLVPEGYIYGAMEDVPLNLTGSATRAAFNAIAGLIDQDTLILSSPSPRALEGIKQVLARTTEPERSIIIEDGFLEQNFGDFCAQLKQEIQDSEAFRFYASDPINNDPPNGESLKGFFERVKTTTEKYRDAYVSGKLTTNQVFVSGHGGVSRAALALCNSATITQEHLEQRIQRLSICRTQWDPNTGQWTIIDRNLTLH